MKRTAAGRIVTARPGKTLWSDRCKALTLALFSVPIATTNFSDSAIRKEATRRWGQQWRTRVKENHQVFFVEQEYQSRRSPPR